MTTRSIPSAVLPARRSPDAAAVRVGGRLLIALLISIAIVKAVIADPIDPDFFWHIRVADQLFTRGIGPIPDPFSFMSKPGNWTPFSWLGELAMRRIFDAGGLRGVVGVHALCSTAFLFFIALSCLEATRQLSGERRRAATCDRGCVRDAAVPVISQLSTCDDGAGAHERDELAVVA